MTAFSFDLVELTKDQIRQLNGGRVRGVELLIGIVLGRPFANVWVFGRLRNQFQSQRQSSRFPEGWEPILADGFVKELKYDLATGKIEIPVPELAPGGVIKFFWRRFPARVYPFDERQEAAVLRLRRAGLWKVRMGLLRAIGRHWDKAPVIGALVAEALGVPWRAQTGEPLPSRLIKLVYELDKQTCLDLAALLEVPNQALPIAA